MQSRRLFPLEISLLMLVCTCWAHAQTWEPAWRPVGSSRSQVSVNVSKATDPGWSPYYRESPSFMPGGIFYRGPAVLTPVQVQPTYPSVVAVPQQPLQVHSVPVYPTTSVPAATTMVPAVTPTPTPAPQPAPTPQPSPQTPARQPAAVAAAPAPMPQPMVSQPAPQPAPQPVPQPAQAPTTAAAPPAENLPAQTPVQSPVQPPVQSPVQTPAQPQQQLASLQHNAPFEDGREFVVQGKRWADMPITAYTSRFHPSTQPEQAIREWLDRLLTGANWLGPELADIAVSSQSVKVYHTPQVQQEVAEIVGRFTNWSPGLFNCRVQLLNVESAKWLKRYQSQLQPVDGKGNKHMWLMNKAAAEQFASEMRTGSGALLLTAREFTVANGQKARVVWVKDPQQTEQAISPSTVLRPDYAYQKPTVDLNTDGIVLEFSPLIAPDAESVDVAAILTTRSTAKKSTVFSPLLGGDGRALPSNARQADLSNLVRIPPNKHLLIAIDGVPTFNPKKRLFNRDRDATILALISIVPDPSNVIVGDPQPPQTAAVDPPASTPLAEDLIPAPAYAAVAN